MAECPLDEYDGLVGMVWRQLESGADEFKLTEKLRHMLTHHFGLSILFDTSEVIAASRVSYVSRISSQQG